MLTIYERAQMALIKNWRYRPNDMLQRSQDVVCLPKPTAFIEYLPYDEVERVLEMFILEREFIEQREAFFERHNVSLMKLKAGKLADSDSLAETVCKNVEFPDLEEAAPDFITEFLMDIPEIISCGLCLVYRIGLCYGYDVRTDTDKFYLISALLTICKNPIASAADIGPSILAKLDIRQLSTTIASDITVRKFAVQSPYLNLFLGKSAAKWYFNEVCEAARHIFQKRWLVDHGKWA